VHHFLKSVDYPVQCKEFAKQTWLLLTELETAKALVYSGTSVPTALYIAMERTRLIFTPTTIKANSSF
jgi:hypothetical protein